MYNNKTILSFIEGFKLVNPKAIEHTFYNGYCYWFANILAQRFHGSIWFNPDLIHFACNINEALYDIYGKIENAILFKDWIRWDEYQVNNPELIESIVSSCIKKTGDYY